MSACQAASPVRRYRGRCPQWGYEVRAAKSLITVVSCLAALLGPAQPAAAADCPSPAGTQISRTSDKTGDFVVIGGGFGHGAGMSQYGAKGAAELGCTRSQILGAYYPGANRSSSIPDALDNVRVSLVPSYADQNLPSSVSVTAVSDRIEWRRNGTSKRQRAGVTWTAAVDSSGRYTVRRDADTIFPAGKGPVEVVLHGKVVSLPSKGNNYNRGKLALQWSGSGENMFVTNKIGSLDRYLYGLAEMPQSWPRAALRAQATAGRTYALAKREARDTGNSKWAACRCDVYDSVSDQAYSAYDHESLAPNWVEAVDSTSQMTLRHDGKTITALYHSSSGGYVESAAFVFGEAFPYSSAFNDSQWERASDNPYSTWAVAFTAEKIGSTFGVGIAEAIRRPQPRGESGRAGDPDSGAGGVVIEGTSGTKTVSGPAFRFKLGLKSALFRVVER